MAKIVKSCHEYKQQLDEINIKLDGETLKYKRVAAHTSQTHAGKHFGRPGAEHTEGLLIPALESSPHLLAHLAATPEI